MDVKKAWRAYEAGDWSSYATVVFADTPSKAKVIAQQTDCLCDVEYIDIRVERFKKMDSHYRGHDEIDWDNDDDRKALVELGWSCDEPSWLCDSCVAKAECRWTEEAYR